MKQDVYVRFDTSKLKERYFKIKQALPDIIFVFPVKCCKNEKVLKIVSDYADGFDVSNINEYNMIKELAKDRLIFASGPMSYELIGDPSVHVSLNSMSLWNDNNGIRVNFNDDERFEKSHFGLNISSVPKRVCESVRYVHFHVSDTRTEKICKGVIDNINYIIRNFPRLEMINIGGHLDDFEFEDAVKYLHSIQTILPASIKLIVEAGDFFLSCCGVLYCKAIDSYIKNKQQIVFLNFSKVAQQRWVHPRLKRKNSEGELFDTYFYGSSCCEGELFYVEKTGKISIGEELCFDHISSYSCEWNQDFNGMNKIEVYFD